MPRVFRNVEVNNRRYDDLLAQMQRMRGKAYLDDGAIRPSELTSDGRHKMNMDDDSWHVLSLDSSGEVVACLRYVEERHAAEFDDLLVRHAAVARCPVFGSKFRAAVERLLQRAQQMRIGFGEVGGWAVAEEYRWTIEPLRIILGTFGLLQLLGSVLGVATATFRHGSAPILRRIGLSSLVADGEELPPYYDPTYSCEMEVLGFDSRFPNPKYYEKVVELSADLTAAPIVCRDSFGMATREAFCVRDTQLLRLPLVPSFAPSLSA